MGRPKIREDNAAKQRAYRIRKKYNEEQEAEQKQEPETPVKLFLPPGWRWTERGGPWVAESIHGDRREGKTEEEVIRLAN